jgi:hypothetical protein
VRARDQHDRLLDEGEEELADTALREVARIERERDQLAEALANAELHLAEWQDPDLDAALDYYKELHDAIAGRIANAKSVRDLNAALVTVLEGVWLHTVDEPTLGRVLLAQFMLRGSEDAGRPPDIALATRMSHWRQLLDRQQPIVPAQRDPGTTIARDDPRVFSDATP